MSLDGLVFIVDARLCVVKGELVSGLVRKWIRGRFSVCPAYAEYVKGSWWMLARLQREG